MPRRLRHRHRHRGRQDRRRRGDRPHARRRGQARRRLQARRHRPRRSRASPTTSCCAAPPGSAQSDEEIAPYRYGPPPSPHLAAALAGEEIEPERLLAAAARPRPAPTPWSARGSAGCWSRLAPCRASDQAPLPGPRPRRRPGAPAGRRRLPRPRHDQPHAADDRGGPRRRPRGRGGRPHSLARGAEPRSRSPTARRSPSLGEVEVETLPARPRRAGQLAALATYRRNRG